MKNKSFLFLLRTKENKNSPSNLASAIEIEQEQSETRGGKCLSKENKERETLIFVGERAGGMRRWGGDGWALE